MMSEKRCPVCGATGIRENTSREYPFHYHGHKTLVTVHGDWCPVCDEMLLGDEHGDKMEEQLENFKQHVDRQAPELLRSVREKLGMSKTQAGLVFGMGRKAIERYEKGEEQMSGALMALLKILDGHPELVSEIWIRPARDEDED